MLRYLRPARSRQKHAYPSGNPRSRVAGTRGWKPPEKLRVEGMTCGVASSSCQMVQEQSQVSLCAACDQEMLADMLVTLLPEPRSDHRVGEQKADLVGSTFNRMCEQARFFVNHPSGNAAHCGRDHGFLLPEPLRYGQPKPFPQTLLKDNREPRCSELISVALQGGKSRI